VLVGVGTGTWRWYASEQKPQAAAHPEPAAPQPAPQKPLTPPVQPPVTPPAPTNPVTPPDDDGAVRDVLERYAMASGRMDARAVSRLRTDISVDDFAASFARYSNYRLTINAYTVTIAGGTASARCSERRWWTPTGGATQFVNEMVTYGLRRGASGWVITSRTVQ
jgi:hypothetical protein